jgi:hypothetical protein
MLKNSSEMFAESDVLRPRISEAIVRTLLYFDIFNYPLTKEEILQFLGRTSTSKEIQKVLNHLVQQNFIYSLGEFFSIQNNFELTNRRRKGNALASQMLPLADNKAKFIGQFPFVKAVMASGSLSKGYMDQDSDLDFFIVTDPGRLWIARMMLVLYKRIFLGNSHKYFCVNYFVSSDNLEIEEKNLFTATELATVIPLFNQGIYFDLLKSNGWLTRFYPNFNPRAATRGKDNASYLKKFLEKLINLFGGSRIDTYCMKLTYKRWVKVYREQYSEADFKIAFKTRKHASKNHPKHYQKKITEVLEQKWKAYSEQYNIEVI